MRRTALPSLALLAILACFAIVLSRPYDGALFRGAETGSSWNQHAIRVGALMQSPDTNTNSWSGWIQQLDQQYPPLLHAIATAASPITGISAEEVGRAMVLWLLAVALGAGLTAWGLTGRSRVAMAAGTATLLVPALAATSLDYYYDLPMTGLLWCSVGTILVSRRKGSVLGGALAGVLFSAACLMKWSAIPQGLPFLFGALAFPLPTLASESKTRRALITVAALITSGVLLFQFTAISMASWQEMGSVTLGEGQESLSRIGRLFRTFRIPGPPKIGTYLLRTVTALLSPLLAGVVVLGTVQWLRSARPGALLFGLGLAVNAVFLLCFVPPADERFLYPLVPALVLPAVFGWASVRPRLRAAGAVAWIVISLAVIWVVHHGAPGLLNQAWKTNPQSDYRGRGLSLDSGDPAVGWFRADDAADRDVFAPDREELFAYLRSCGGETLVVAQAALQDHADATWWDYRVALQKLHSTEDTFARLMIANRRALAGSVTEPALPHSSGLLILRNTPGQDSAVGPSGWRLIGEFKPQNHPGLTVWGTSDLKRCP